MPKYNLTSQQKELLKTIVEHVKSGKAKEPLIPVISHNSGSSIIGIKKDFGRNLLGNLEVLYEADLLSSQYGSKGNKIYTVKQYAYDAVENDFVISEKEASTQNNRKTIIRDSENIWAVGSPYGFTDDDWEIVKEKRAQNDTLYIVFGYQWKSTHYKTDELTKNIKAMFVTSVKEYNNLHNSQPIQLNFKKLAAGYGEHLFNNIARDVIPADIAVFETSDNNPNVFIELGIALTWDVLVFPIKRQGSPEPPSDISGQTWADYIENGSSFIDPDHNIRLLELIERASRKKRNASNKIPEKHRRILKYVQEGYGAKKIAELIHANQKGLQYTLVDMKKNLDTIPLELEHLIDEVNQLVDKENKS